MYGDVRMPDVTPDDEVRRIIAATGDRRLSFYAEPVTLPPSGASLRVWYLGTARPKMTSA